MVEPKEEGLDFEKSVGCSFLGPRREADIKADMVMGA